MKESLLRTVMDLIEEAEYCRKWGHFRLEEVLRRAARQLEQARVEAMPADEPVIILGYVNEDEPHG